MILFSIEYGSKDYARSFSTKFEFRKDLIAIIQMNIFLYDISGTEKYLSTKCAFVFASLMHFSKDYSK